MERNDKNSWQSEFVDFISTDSASVPPTLTMRILGHVADDLNPSAFAVFRKISFIQFLVGTFTLLFCPQFGISLTSSQGLMPYLMKFGDSVCMLGCGALFTGLSFIIVSVALRPEEIRALKRNEVLQLVSLAALSLGSFVCVGGEIVITLGLVWALGAVLSAAVTLEAGWAMRKYFARRAFA